MTARYAIYYTPEESSELFKLSQAWFDDSPTQSLTTNPRFYGFHGTLKAPFSLKEGENEASLSERIVSFTKTQQAFDIPKLQVAEIGKFIALTPESPSEALNTLAANCVSVFDECRAPISDADLKKRPDTYLTPQEAKLRQKWGYPYVMELFKFHLTLTNVIENEKVRAIILEVLSSRFIEIESALRCDSISLFMQPDRDTPFIKQQRFYFGDNK